MQEQPTPTSPKITFTYQVIRADGTVEDGEGDAELTPDALATIQQALLDQKQWRREEQALFSYLDPIAPHV